MNRVERRAVAGLAGIFGLRMLGLFLILPVFALYAEHLDGATPFLIGVALGAYGLTQALLQIPYGLLSDRFGRKRIIAAGLVVFALGSAVAATSDSIAGVIAGRALQGAGAIAAAVLALAADVTREQQRTKAMAVIGGTIGLMFAAAFVLGPLLESWVGVPGIFWLTLVLALAALPILWFVVPTPVRGPRAAEAPLSARLAGVLRDGELIRLDVGIFVLHAVLTALFVVVPVALARSAGLAAGEHWKIYVPVLALSLVGMVPLVLLSARAALARPLLSVAIAILLLSQVVLYFGHDSLAGLLLGMWVFFVGFNSLEAMLPATVSRVAAPRAKGTALGVYNSFEFMGVFAGGAGGGLVYGAFGVAGVFVFCALLSLAWLVAAVLAPARGLHDSVELAVGRLEAADGESLAVRLQRLPGVVDVTVIAREGVAYLKVERGRFDNRLLEEFTGGAAVSALPRKEGG